MPAKKVARKKKAVQKPPKKKPAGRPQSPSLESCQTLKQASVKTGLSISTIKRVRDEFGAKCFRSGRIYINELMDWVGKNADKLKSDGEGAEPISKEDWQIEEIKLRCQKIEIANAEKRGELIEAKSIVDMVTLLGVEILKIHRQNETNLPPFLSNMEPDQVRVVLRRVTDEVAKRMQPILEPWTEKWNHSPE